MPLRSAARKSSSAVIFPSPASPRSVMRPRWRKASPEPREEAMVKASAASSAFSEGEVSISMLP